MNKHIGVRFLGLSIDQIVSIDDSRGISIDAPFSLSIDYSIGISIDALLSEAGARVEWCSLCFLNRLSPY